MDFRKEHEKPELKLGFVEGRILSAEEVKALASLPTRDQLISQVMQLALAPVQGVAMALNGIATKLVRTVDAVRDGMEKGTIAAAPGEEPAGEKSAADEKSAEETPAEAKAVEDAPESEEAPAAAEAEDSAEAGDKKDEPDS